MEKHERHTMMYSIADNIVSPLGFSTQENYAAVLDGQSRLCLYDNPFGCKEPAFLSLVDGEQLDESFHSIVQSVKERYTKLEKMAILSVFRATQNLPVRLDADDVLFVFSTTKGNISLLEANDYEKERIYLWRSAELIARFFGNSNTPIVVSNACISGCAAQLAASSFMQHHGYRYAVVVGAEVLSKFIVSGFQSFKALSSSPCKPFDQDRCGLNLGEAAATIVYADSSEEPKTNTVLLRSGHICNDANHISGPSRTGEGLYRAISKTLSDYASSNISFINAHGTATLYNDDMESVAINRAGLADTFVNSYKGYYGHTLGAAGILEVILSSHGLLNNTILKCRGTEIVGTTAPLKVCTSATSSEGTAFLKLISGFGGCNAALLFTKKCLMS